MFARILLIAVFLLAAVEAWGQPVTVIGPVNPGNCAQWNSTTVLKDAGAPCGGGGGAVSSVSNSDGSLTIAPTTGAVVGSINVAHSNAWTAFQSINLSGGSLPAGLPSADIFEGVAANGVQTTWDLLGFANAGRFMCLRAEGTISGFTALATGSTACNTAGGGWDGAAWVAGAATFTFVAQPSGATWSTTDHGMGTAMAVTVPGTTIKLNGIWGLGASNATTVVQTVGLPGNVLGELNFGNTTSGNLLVTPPAGALGTNTLNTLQAANDTFVYRATVDTLTNKTASVNNNTILPSPTRAGDLVYWNGSSWVTLAGNNSGTNVLTENSSGVPSWAAGGGSNPTLTTMTTGNTAAANATALGNDCARSATIYIPAGTYNLSAATLTGCSSIYGDGPGKTILVAAGSPTTALLFFNGNTTAIVQHLEVDVNLASFPSLNGIECSGTGNCLISDVIAQGNTAVLCTNSTNGCDLEWIQVTSYSTNGIIIGVTGGKILNSSAVTGGSGGTVGMGCNAGASFCVLENNVVVGAGIFGFTVQDTGQFIVKHNRSLNSIHEAFNITVNTTNVTKGVVEGNLFQFNASHVDFCVSSTANAAAAVISNVVFTNNICDSPAKSAFIATVAVNGGAETRIMISNNLIISPNALNLDGGPPSACTLQGNITVSACYNNTINDVAGHMTYRGSEAAASGASPNNNTFGPDYGSRGSNAGGPYLLVGAGSQYIDLDSAWIAYTPTFICGGGSVAGYTTQNGHFKLQGKTVEFSVNIQASGAGSCTLPLFLVLPFTLATSEHVFAGRDVTTGNMMQAFPLAGSNGASLVRYDNANPTIADQFTVSGVFQRN